MADQSHNFAILEPSAWLACHILQYLFTSAPRTLIYRHTTFDQRMLTASFLLTLPFNSFLLVLKGLFLLSNPIKDTGSTGNSRSTSKGNNSSSSKSVEKSNSSKMETNHLNEDTSEQPIELDQFASNVLQEICEHNWIKERCFNEGDNLLKQNQLLEPALGRRAQSLLHIICYPRSHCLRKQNDSSTKDFIKNILQNLDIWTLRESLLEFKLMIELQKQKDSYYEYFVECLAKTTVDFLIDPEKPSPSALANATSLAKARSRSVNDDIISEKVNSNSQSNSTDVNSVQESLPDQLKSPLTNLNIEQMETNSEQPEHELGDLNNKNYESDSIFNFELDQMEQVECDELELLRMHKENQPVSIWLIAPLITKLQDNCQLKVLEYACEW